LGKPNREAAELPESIFPGEMGLFTHGRGVSTGTCYHRLLPGLQGETYNFLSYWHEEFMQEATGTSPIRLSQELTIFHDVAKALTSSLDLDSILQTIMEKMAEYFRPDTWSLLMVDEEKDELYFAIAVGTASDVLQKERLKVGEGLAGWVAKHGQLLTVPDVQADSRFSPRLDELTQLTTRSVVCVPLRSKHRVLGVIQLVNASVGHERPGDVLPAIALRLRSHLQSKMRARSRRSRSSPSPTIAPACSMRGIFTRRSKPRCTARRASATSSA
jgi:putative methionine-R-sulfoxide reductase with GAF domain